MNKCVYCGEEFGRFEETHLCRNGIVCSRCFDLDCNNIKIRKSTKKNFVKKEIPINQIDMNKELVHDKNALSEKQYQDEDAQIINLIKEEHFKRNKQLKRLRMFVALIALVIVVIVSYPGLKNLYHTYIIENNTTVVYSEDNAEEDTDEASLLNRYLEFLAAKIKTLFQ